MDKQIAPQRKYHPPYEDECPAQPMSATRTNAAIADDLAEWRKGVSSQPLKAVMMEAIAALRKEPPASISEHNDAELALTLRINADRPSWPEAAKKLALEAATAIERLTQEPPALPAEKCKDCHGKGYAEYPDEYEDGSFSRSLSAHPCQSCSAQPAEVEAVLAKLAEIAKTSRFETWDGWAETADQAATMLRRYAQSVAEKDAEIARLTAIEERAKSYRALLTPGSYCEISECQVFDDMTVILWEEH